jgi:hypothetical protein
MNFKGFRHFARSATIDLRLHHRKRSHMVDGLGSRHLLFGINLPDLPNIRTPHPKFLRRGEKFLPRGKIFLRGFKEIVYFLANVSSECSDIWSYGNLKKFLKKFVLKECFQTLLTIGNYTLFFLKSSRIFQ